MSPIDGLDDVLHSVFHRDGFRPTQREIIEQVLNHRDVLVILPTGHGKSLTFQLPAYMESRSRNGNGFYIVISPLIALMRDQVQQMRDLGVPAATLNSSMTTAERNQVMQDASAGEYAMLYVSPELCLTPAFRQYMHENRSRMRRIVVDEAHCAVEWGADFRKEYASLGSVLRSEFRDLPFMALTGTASPLMQTQILKLLGMPTSGSHIFVGPMNRPNLHYEVRYVEDGHDRLEDLIKFLRMFRGRVAKLNRKQNANYAGSGIIYCRMRSSTVQIAGELNDELGPCAAAFHAGLEPQRKEEVMRRWISGDPKYSIVVATIAFGLGIDKPDTRFVIHYDLPNNIEAYVQQTGRAGRDRRAARCILYYSSQDARRIVQFARDKETKEVHPATVALVRFATTTNQCRHAYLGVYFGSPDIKAHCEYACDYCKSAERLQLRFNEWAAS